MSKPYRKVLIGIGSLVVVCVVGALALFLPDDEPDENVLLTALGADLPAYWSVRSVEISVSSKSEDQGLPVYQQRFEAAVSPQEELYVPADDDGGSIGPFEVVSRKSVPTEEYTLHGVATTRAANEMWSTEFVLDNSVSGLGVPRSAFNGPVVVAGSERAARLESELASARELAAAVASAAWATATRPSRN